MGRAYLRTTHVGEPCLGHSPGLNVAETKGTRELVGEGKGGLQRGADHGSPQVVLRCLSFGISTMPNIQQVLKKLERMKLSVNLGTGMG